LATSSPVQSFVTLPTVAPIFETKSNETNQRKSLAMCFTSTGAALSLPPKKKDIYRPYSLDDKPSLTRYHDIRIPAEEDLHAAHAILDLSASTVFFSPPVVEQQKDQQQLQPMSYQNQNLQPPKDTNSINSHTAADLKVDNNLIQQPSENNLLGNLVQNENQNNTNINHNKSLNLFNAKPTVKYTFEAFFVSDGRSKRNKPASVADTIPIAPTDQKTKYSCTECGKQYATSSNLSRHKQTHRSLDSQSAKKCKVCFKAYVSMPALVSIPFQIILK
jgi:scratch